MGAPRLPVLDDFNRANTGPPPSANWAAMPFLAAFSAHKVVTNQAVAGGAGNNAASWWTAQDFGPDCEVYLTAVSLNAVEDYVSLYARTFSGAGLNGYELSINLDGSNTWNVVSYTADTGTQIGASAVQSVANGASLGMVVFGSTIEGWYKAPAGSWSLVVSRTDTTHGGAGKVGWYHYRAASTFDNFAGGTLLAARRALLGAGL